MSVIVRATLAQSWAAPLWCVVVVLSALLGGVSGGTAWAQSADQRFDQRNLYKRATAHISAGRVGEYRRLAKGLRDYPLYPYLRYREVRARVINGTISNSEFASFLATHRDLPVTRLLHIRWYKKQGGQRRWQALLDLPLESTDPTVRCYQLRARYNTTDKAGALADVAQIWTQPRSQPKACDPLFEVWLKSDYFSEDIAWERLTLALQKNERQLAQYLIRYLSGANKTLGEAFIAVHQAPNRLTRTGGYRVRNSRERALVTHGLLRLSRRDPEAARQAWRAYAKAGQFSEEQSASIEAAIAVAAAEKGDFPPSAARTIRSESVVDLAQAAVEQENWGEVQRWTAALSDLDHNKAQWRYWRARAARELGRSDQDDDLQQLAQLRQYYGFLAAQDLGMLGQLQQAHSDSSPVALNNLKRIPGMHRAMELFAVGDDVNGRREWFAALRVMTEHEQKLAAQQALNLGQTYLAISTANIAEAHNHLNLRFPVVHQQQFRSAAHTTGLPTALLFAVARQESAMNRRARSHANARGLMQMLPSTARLVARRAGRSTPSATDLYNPTINISLGSYHLAWLTSRYEGREELAIAAYNAGEHRVDRWIRDKSGLDLVTWIEQIPFKETRNYVKNVLAFKHVYAQLLGEARPMLDDALRTVP